MPDLGIINLYDAESGESLSVDSGNAKVRNSYRQRSLSRIEERSKLFRSAGVDNIDIYTDKPYEKELIKFFKARAKKINRR